MCQGHDGMGKTEKMSGSPRADGSCRYESGLEEFPLKLPRSKAMGIDDKGSRC